MNLISANSKLFTQAELQHSTLMRECTAIKWALTDYAYSTLHDHWIAKLGLPEILVTDNGTEFMNNEIITLCHIYNIEHKHRTSHAPWTNG